MINESWFYCQAACDSGLVWSLGFLLFPVQKNANNFILCGGSNLLYVEVLFDKVQRILWVKLYYHINDVPHLVAWFFFSLYDILRMIIKIFLVYLRPANFPYLPFYS